MNFDPQIVAQASHFVNALRRGQRARVPAMPFCLWPQFMAVVNALTEEEIARVLGAYCFIRLDNGDEAFYVNGQFVGSTDAARCEPPVYNIAILSARAAWQPLRCHELPVPESGKVCWPEIVAARIRLAPSAPVRGEVIVTGCRTKQGWGIHFCAHPLLSGTNSNLWFPVTKEDGWFVATERILVMNGVAENLTEMKPLRERATYTDWKAVYNRKVTV